MSDTDTRNRIEDLLQLMAALRTPGTGCPWDLAQDYSTIVPYTIEEAYEVADAIARGDMADLRDELGDLLFQVVFYARLAEEDGLFDFFDVVTGVTQKMIRRHPHVFGNSPARSDRDLQAQWDHIKRAERTQKQLEESKRAVPRTSLLDDVPLSLPALMRAVKLQNRAARVGFDWPDLLPVLDKLHEELAEFENELSPLLTEDGSGSYQADRSGSSAARPSDGSLSGEQKDKIEDELGDLLFVIANLARHLKIDPENALRRSNDKFVRRFRHIEQRLAEHGRSVEDASLDEMEYFWNEIRHAENHNLKRAK